MRILLASSEVYPYSKTGGLADSVGALSKALARAGHEVVVVTPLYRSVRESLNLQPVEWRFNLPLGPKTGDAGLFMLEPSARLRLYFVSKPELYERTGIYGEYGADYADNGERFVFFSKCVVNLARYLPFKAEIIHIHDWHTGLVPLLVGQEMEGGKWADAPKVVLTIHNLAYQGVFPGATFGLTNLPATQFNAQTCEFYGQLNCLKAGISTADVITTVSPRYAREITTPEFGAGLDGLLRQRQDSLFGILNGVDYDEWNTTHNAFLASSYSLEDLSGKAACKTSLQEELGLKVNSEVPLFGVVTRLAEQKGVDVALGALEEMLSADMQFALLGSGSPSYERSFSELVGRWPGKVAVHIGYNQALAHRIEAGCDFYLMPSKFEPCGLNQMYSLRFGTIPIVRRTGGLDDTVIDLLENPEAANGIKFTEYSPPALAKAIRKALVLYGDNRLMDHYRRNGMKANFSWETAVRHYGKAYQHEV